MIYRIPIFIVILITGISLCTNPVEEEPLFTLLPGEQTGIDFENTLSYNREFNVYTYRNFYNGGGVSIADFNNDNLLDIYLTANMTPNKLYLNLGDWKFEDVTQKAGVGGERSWSTGTSAVDINADGWMDIYVCNSGDIDGDNKENELFINNGDGTFTEQAKRYGLNDRGYSTHASFFDYDKDGDLDCYLLNNSYQAIGSFNLRKRLRPVRDSVGGDKLYRNDGLVFTDVSEEAGIYGSVIGFGLGVTVGDVNADQWPDIYVSNDFFERDYLYLNNRDGSFTESLTSSIPTISAASMGADMADINNDLRPDIFVTDMLPGDDARLKTKTTFDNWDRYRYNVDNDLHHQFTRNTMQLNMGGEVPQFTEIGRLSGVAATDWSWGALILDMDLDGLKDIFVANGIYKDLTDQDFINYLSNENIQQDILSGDSIDFRKLIDIIPSNPLPNFAFKNKGELEFEDIADEWGLGTPSFSNGSAYGDLDNDGDPDLVVNNINMPLFIYRNNSIEHLGHHYLKINLEGTAGNPLAIGATAWIKAGDQWQHFEMMLSRGFQSSVAPELIAGVGKHNIADSLIIRWPDGNSLVKVGIPADTALHISYPGAKGQFVSLPTGSKKKPLLQEARLPSSIRYSHVENEFVDFDRDRLLFHMLSREGPCGCSGDFDGDGRRDYYLGGAKDQPGQLYTSRDDAASSMETLSADAASEDSDCAFFDADQDGDLDLYVASGGSEFSSNSIALVDRLYLNDNGTLRKSTQLLPSSNFISTGVVSPADIDADGDVDLFIGSRFIPTKYGAPVSGYLLINDGKGNFTDETESLAPGLLESGMYTDALWEDVDRDGDVDLVTIGDWMTPMVWRNEGGQFTPAHRAIPTHLEGWWNVIEAIDVNNDGAIDLALGNHGQNSRFKADSSSPVLLSINDFDNNGYPEHIFSIYEDGQAYPLALRHDLIKQMPQLKKKFLTYEDYKNKTIEDIFTPEQREGMLQLHASELRSGVLINDGSGNFTFTPLPLQAQFAPVYAIHTDDINGDGFHDLLLGGNLYQVKPEVGRYDAGGFTLLINNEGKEFFPAQKNAEYPVIDGQVRAILPFQARQEGIVEPQQMSKELPGGFLLLRNDADPLYLTIAETPVAHQ